MKKVPVLLVVVAVAAVLGCGRRGGRGGGGDDDGHAGPGDDDGDGDGPVEDPYWCCDPDATPCECQGFWHCTETDEGKRCTQDNPSMPDSGGSGAWDCRYDETMIVCVGRGDEHPDAGADGAWDCQENGEMVECSREADEGDYPDEGADAPWDCDYDVGNDLRECTSEEEEELPDDDGECALSELTCDDLDDNDCDGFTDCVDSDCPCGGGDEVCDGRDNNGDGRIDEGRACGDGGDGEGACPPGAVRICDAYCGVHQICGPEGGWGPCFVDGTCEPVPQCDQHSDCPYGEYCDFGGCISGSFLGFGGCVSDEDCGFGFGFEGYTCYAEQGVCILDCYHHSDCGPGLVCDLGSCVVDPYVPGTC
jgi:hypothetical protein